MFHFRPGNVLGYDCFLQPAALTSLFRRNVDSVNAAILRAYGVGTAI